MRFELGSTGGWRALIAGIAVLGSANATMAQTTKELPLPASGRHAAAVDEVSASITESMSERNLPGVSAAVAVDGELVWADGFGWADLDGSSLSSAWVEGHGSGWETGS